MPTAKKLLDFSRFKLDQLINTHTHQNTNMKQNMLPVITNLLETMHSAGYVPTRMLCGGKKHLPKTIRGVVCFSTYLITQCDEGEVGLFFNTPAGNEIFLQIYMENNPSEIVTDFSNCEKLSDLMEKWSNSWQDCVWVPQKAKL